MGLVGLFVFFINFFYKSTSRERNSEYGLNHIMKLGIAELKKVSLIAEILYLNGLA